MSEFDERFEENELTGLVEKGWMKIVLDYQQKKIYSVLKYLDGCECSLDVDIDSIKELLK